MTTRARQPTTRRAEPEVPETAQTPLPLLAASTFCDDVRLEASGKFCMIGCYPGNIILADPGQQITRLWLFTRLRWNPDFDPAGLRVRLDLPAQGTGYMDVKPNPPTSDALARDAMCVWQLRLLPLRVGDLLRVSIETGSALLPCGELLVVEAAKPTRH